MKNRIHRQALLLLGMLVACCCSHTWASTAEVTSTVPAAPPSPGGGQNPVVQLVGFVKDSVVRTVDGCGQLWTNHKECNRIRAKQKEHRLVLQKQWENEGRMSREEMKQNLQSVNGGISYSEYAFLAKGKDDRGKLMNVAFLMWGAPRFLPYALMFYPSMLPSPFAPLPDGSVRESKFEKASRERSYAVVQTLLNLERDAMVVPALAKLNIFGKKKQQLQMDSMQAVGKITAQVFTTPNAKGPFGAQVILNTLDQCLYRATEFTRSEKRLVGVPKSVMVGLITALEGPSPLNAYLPNFMTRGKVISHIRKITESDEFLVNEGIDLDSLDKYHLVEACSERLIGGPGYEDDELRTFLSEWLNAAVVQPSERLQQTGEQHNANLARMSLLCYFALDGVRDQRSSSYLPRLFFQGQVIAETSVEPPAKKKKK